MAWVVGDVAERMDAKVTMQTGNFAVSHFARRIAYFTFGLSALKDRGVFGHLLFLLARRAQHDGTRGACRRRSGKRIEERFDGHHLIISE